LLHQRDDAVVKIRVEKRAAPVARGQPVEVGLNLRPADSGSRARDRVEIARSSSIAPLVRKFGSKIRET
jgi:hypothetical protein